MRGNPAYDAILSLCRREGFAQVLQTATTQWFEREPRKAARAVALVELALETARWASRRLRRRRKSGRDEVSVPIVPHQLRAELEDELGAMLAEARAGDPSRLQRAIVLDDATGSTATVSWLVARAYTN